jgi:hypothetical protein
MTVSTMKPKLRYEQYGRFNAIYIGYAPVYYFFLVWVLRSIDGRPAIGGISVPHDRFR